jgi:hypothetical protein
MKKQREMFFWGKRCTELSKTHYFKSIFVLLLSWLTDAEASSLIRDAASPAFSGFQKTNRSQGSETTKKNSHKSCKRKNRMEYTELHLWLSHLIFAKVCHNLSLVLIIYVFWTMCDRMMKHRPARQTSIYSHCPVTEARRLCVSDHQQGICTMI